MKRAARRSFGRPTVSRTSRRFRRRRAPSASVAASVERSGISANVVYMDALSACDITPWLEPALDGYSSCTMESF